MLAIRNGNTGAPGEQGERLPKLTSDPHIYLESLLSTTLTTVDSTHARPRSVASLGAPPLGRGVPGACAPAPVSLGSLMVPPGPAKGPLLLPFGAGLPRRPLTSPRVIWKCYYPMSTEDLVPLAYRVMLCRFPVDI